MNKRILWTSISTIAILLLTMALAQPAFASGGNVTLIVLDSHNNPLDGVNVYYNDYSNHWVLLGTTAGDAPVTASFADGTYNFKAIKDHSQQVASVDVDGTGEHTFQTDKFTVNVKDSTPANFSGIAVAYNDYSNHYLSMGTTDGDGDASIELFPGTYKFRATKDHSTVTGTTDEYVEFQTAKFTVHVKDSGEADFPGIAVAYNDYSNHYLSMGNTDSDGNATIELFPGTYKFRATKDHSTVTGTTDEYVEFQTAKFTVHVKDSGEADFPGIAVAYNDYSNHYLSMGNTGIDGNASIELFPGTYTFRASKDHTYDTKDLDNNAAGTEETIAFQTAEAIAYVKDCSDGTPLDGFNVAFNDYSNHWLSMGTTDINGKASIELFPGTRKFRASIDHTYEAKDLELTLTDSSVEFNPTKVDWQYSGTVKYNDYSNHWKTMTSPFYLFPGTYAFRFDGVQQDISISGCAMEGSVLVITLKDSYGNGVAGGTAHLGVGGWPVIGTTDANGVLLYFHNSALGNMRIRMDAPFYGGSQESPVQDTSVNSIFDFQTSQVVIQLKDSAGNLIDGGVVQAGAGGWPGIGTTGDDGTGTLYHEHFAGTFKYRMGYHGSSMEIQQDVSLPFIFQTTKAVIRLEDHNGDPLNGGKVLQGIGGWPQIGVTGDSAPGEVWYELFPGTHTFRMSYNYGTEEKSQDISTPVVFQTALVDLQFSGSIQHQVGGWPGYTGPLEMLPVNHGFRFNGCGTSQILAFTPTAGTVFAKSIVFASLKDSGGSGLAGGDFQYRFGWGSYNSMGTTPASGLIVYPIDGLHTNTKFRVTYAGGTTGDQEQNIATDSCVAFQTELVTAQLLSSTNADLSNDATFEYRYGWGSYMPFTGPTELLPINIKMRVSYAGGTTGDTEQNVGSDSSFDFNTVSVTAQLLSSTNADLSNDATFEYRYGWGSYMPFTGPTELLPINIKMRVSYAGGTTGDTEQNVGSDPSFDFNTVSVTAALKDSSGSGTLPGTFEYRYGWGSYMPFTDSTELLPINIKMRVSYAGGTTGDTEQNVGSDSSFDFQTGSVTGTDCTQYRYGWGSYMTFSDPMELLAVSTKFSDADGPDTTALPISGSSISVSCP